MTRPVSTPVSRGIAGFLSRLARDRGGNTLALVAAAIFPILAMVGSGVDMSRSYLSQSRLQQACDSGVLAARKRLGTTVAVTGDVPEDVAQIGQRFFNLNFRDGSYGTEDRTFEMTLEEDYAVSGVATVIVPTTVMRVFGFTEVPVQVTCQAQLSAPNLDVMMVLDTTGSMAQTIPGGVESKIAVLRSVVKSFYAQVEAAKSSGSRTRYGFVPYSSNVNVGYLLKPDWVVDEEQVPARVAKKPAGATDNDFSDLQITPVSGSYSAISTTTKATCPESTGTWTDLSLGVANNGDDYGRAEVDGKFYTCTYNNWTGKYSVSGVDYSKYVFDWVRPQKARTKSTNWEYMPVTVDVSPLKTTDGNGNALIANLAPTLTPTELLEVDPLGLLAQFQGCIMERKTYEIDDYGSVNLGNALDLDIDRVPESGDPDTQWVPLLSEVYIERLRGSDLNHLDRDLARSLSQFYVEPLNKPACPKPARKLATMTAAEVAAYVDALTPNGNTYHDIGMIWGGRLLSPTGIFADENADLPNGAVSRHLIFLTDGETATNYNNYTSYGIEAYEQRRWTLTSGETLNQVVESRFTYACDQVKNKNITVWVIAFGTDMTPMLSNCAGAGHYFAASDATTLEHAFSTIAKQMSELRISQ